MIFKVILPNNEISTLICHRLINNPRRFTLENRKYFASLEMSLWTALLCHREHLIEYQWVSSCHSTVRFSSPLGSSYKLSSLHFLTFSRHIISLWRAWAFLESEYPKRTVQDANDLCVCLPVWVLIGWWVGRNRERSDSGVHREREKQES